MPKKKVEEVSTETLAADLPTETVTPEVTDTELQAETEEVLDTKGEFSFIRKGTSYGVLHNGVQISALTTQQEAEQLFRGMTRKF